MFFEREQTAFTTRLKQFVECADQLEVMIFTDSFTGENGYDFDHRLFEDVPRCGNQDRAQGDPENGNDLSHVDQQANLVDVKISPDEGKTGANNYEY